MGWNFHLNKGIKRNTMKRAHKTENRLKLIDSISEAITDRDDFDSLNYRTYNESRIKQSLNHFLVSAVKDYFVNIGYEKEQAKKAAYECVFWEGTPTKTIHNRIFLGCNHRPDFEVHFDNLKIAVEVKVGGAGEALRSGLGQALVYSQFI